MLGSLVLLGAAWLASGTPPQAPTGWLAPAAVVIAILWGAVAPTLINFDEQFDDWQLLVIFLFFPLSPFGLASWGASALLAGSAYAYLAAWCWWSLAGCAALTLLVAAWRFVRRWLPSK